MMLVYLAVSMGLMSSFHCIGMCGPIALALPIHKGTKLQQWGGMLLYNVGRTTTYAAFGAAFGLVGSSLAWLGYFRYILVGVGVLMILYVVWPTFLERHLKPPVFWQKAVLQVKGRMAKLLASRTSGGWFLLGVFNGLLPCGMVYMAVISSVATGSALYGAIFMGVFGLGTMPAMMAVSFFRQWLSADLRSRFRRLTPVLVAAAGVWIVARGLLITPPASSVGYPSGTEIPICHGKDKK
jgi:sulfite exporter TauE/SafE